MCILRVRWTVIPKAAPQPWIRCSGCGGLKPHRSSGRIRLNANGKTLDAWLVYRCATCEATWNRPLLERRNAREVDPAVLAALRSGDPDWIRARAFDVAELRRWSGRIDEFPDADVRKVALGDMARDWAVIEIELVVPLTTSLRLDRLLGAELGLSRSRLKTLHDRAKLRTDPDRKDMLRHPVKHGTRVTLDLSGEPDLHALAGAATGSTCADTAA